MGSITVPTSVTVLGEAYATANSNFALLSSYFICIDGKLFTIQKGESSKSR